MHAPLSKTEELPSRLCSEIQLFDLCDLDSCGYKKGRFCTDNQLILRFEKIAENEIRQPESYGTDDDFDENDDENEFGVGFNQTEYEAEESEDEDNYTDR
ncbi:MAG: hypothetical protein PHN84_14820 [Desulfuromonadaceae bacterium]|nr:hypothetical protein [Desulfuromonadaceae bacterium]